jgi:hypothetical protein
MKLALSKRLNTLHTRKLGGRGTLEREPKKEITELPVCSSAEF